MDTTYHVLVNGTFTNFKGEVKTLTNEVNCRNSDYGNAQEFICANSETHPDLTFKIVMELQHRLCSINSRVCV